MTDKLKHHSVYTHERRWKTYVDRHQLERIILDAVAADIGLTPDARVSSAKVDIRAATEGSPPYRVGYCAHVEIVTPLSSPEAAP